MTVLRYGSTGSEVRKLQEALNRHGYKLNVDGVFGSATASAVKDFQKKRGLAVDGVVGSKTWSALSAPDPGDFVSAVRTCLSDIENLPSFKKLMEMW